MESINTANKLNEDVHQKEIEKMVNWLKLIILIEIYA